MLKATSSIVNVSQITGVLPVVNGGTGVTTSTGTGNTVLSAAPTLSGNVTLSTGNLIVASGQGIDFSATPGTGTSELLADYEEGTWTPAAAFSTSDGDLSYARQIGRYIKTGSLVTLTGFISFSETTASGNLSITGLPFASANIFQLHAGGGLTALNFTGLAGGCFWAIGPNTSVMNVFQGRTGDIGVITNANTSVGAGFFFSCSYQAA